MIHITGDTHRNFSRLQQSNINIGDTLIILGDSCFNYFFDEQDTNLKKMMNCFGITYFCIQGNNEERAENIQSYKEKEMYGGKVYVEDEYPNIVFAKSGELYNIDGKSVLVVGGAYSIDKDFKLSVGAPWFQSEQLTKEEKENILNKYKGMHIDVILTHTCPKKYEPTEVFDKNIDQTKVDKSMEEFLDVLEESIEYDEWYCGHYHIEKDIDKIKFMHKSIIEFNKKMSKSK